MSRRAALAVWGAHSGIPSAVRPHTRAAALVARDSQIGAARAYASAAAEPSENGTRAPSYPAIAALRPPGWFLAVVLSGSGANEDVLDHPIDIRFGERGVASGVGALEKGRLHAVRPTVTIRRRLSDVQVAVRERVYYLYRPGTSVAMTDSA